MSDEKKPAAPQVRARIIKASPPPASGAITKADASTQLDREENFNAGDWLYPPIDLQGLAVMVDESTILPQCVRAYKSNIAGFGIEVRYKDDFADKEESPEMKAEWERATEVLDLLSIEQESKEVFEDLIEAREIYGCSYLEVIRNLGGEVVQIEFIRDTPSITKTKPLDPYVDVDYFYKDHIVQRKRRFRKYKQQVGGKTVYYKEFGDPRMMDNRNGEYVTEGKRLDRKFQANEIMEFAISTPAYGKVRWLGQVLTVDGSRRAEALNNNYFVNGRHTPLLIMVKGGSLTDDSFTKLQGYMDDIKGEAGQHAFMVLETEASDNRTGFNNDNRPEIEVKDLAAILQKDELFQDYLSNNRRKVQSSFQLPDLYVGYTTDFNRATAQTAMEVTEKQVFQPERRSLAWAINNRLLNGYQFKYVEVYFREPDITNPDDLFKILTVCNNAGGLTPNKAKAVAYDALGEVAEDFGEDWGEIPLAIQQRMSSSMPGVAAGAPSVAQAASSGQIDRNTPSSSKEPENGAQSGEAGDGGDGNQKPGNLEEQLDNQIAKAAAANEGELVAVMKEVRRLLVRIDEKEAE